MVPIKEQTWNVRVWFTVCHCFGLFLHDVQVNVLHSLWPINKYCCIIEKVLKSTICKTITNSTLWSWSYGNLQVLSKIGLNPIMGKMISCRKYKWKIYYYIIYILLRYESVLLFLFVIVIILHRKHMRSFQNSSNRVCHSLTTWDFTAHATFNLSCNLRDKT